MSLPASIMVTAEDYRSLPEGGPRYQLIDGELFVSPAPDRYHQEISGNLEFILRSYLKTNPLGKLYDAPFDVYLSEFDVVQPDILFVSNERGSILTDAGAEGAPNLVVEILSPKTSRLDKDSKRKVYARSGVEELWLIDPKEKTIAIYLLQKRPEEASFTFSENDAVSSELFPGLTIDAREVFEQ
jgi:Uma2 family endonuclease